MEVYNDRMCLTGEEVWAVLGSNFNTLLGRRRLRNVSGRACYNRPGLYAVDDFPNSKRRRYRDELYAAYPELSEWKRIQDSREAQCWLLDNAVPDASAHAFFSGYRKPGGQPLGQEERTRYANSAMILNAIRRVWDKSFSGHARAGTLGRLRKGEFFSRMARSMPEVSARYPLSFRRFSARRLQELYESYLAGGYATLVSGKEGNSNRRKKNRKRIEQVILSIYGSGEKLFVSDVRKYYNEFLQGRREIYNRDTGEVYDRSEFFHNGDPETVSDAMVWGIINDPLNRKVVDRKRNDFHYNQERHNPDVQRKPPRFSLSKVSLDDRDLVRKAVVVMENPLTGKKERREASVHAYYAYDVASGAIIGSAYSMKKDAALVEECMRSMWGNLRRWELPAPYEFEVENHLIRGTVLEEKFRDTCVELRFCAPLNSREKRAEHLNRAKKYHGESSEVKLGMARGRHYARHEAYLYRPEKVFDEMNDTFRNPVKALDWEAVIREDREQIAAYNSELHPGVEDRKAKRPLYPGMTRMQVLTERVNGEKCAPIDWLHVCRVWGVSRGTSVKRGRSVTVDYREWWLSSPGVITRLRPGKTDCTAFWIPDPDGTISEIHLYQDGRYIDTPEVLGRFQEAVAERTEEDIAIMNRQLGFISSAGKLARDRREEVILGRIGTLRSALVDRAISASEAFPETGVSPPVEEAEDPGYIHPDGSGKDWAAIALDSI
jgi:hypothetical protein